jgi:hypothetical protein
MSFSVLLLRRMTYIFFTDNMMPRLASLHVCAIIPGQTDLIVNTQSLRQSFLSQSVIYTFVHLWRMTRVPIDDRSAIMAPAETDKGNSWKSCS